MKTTAAGFKSRPKKLSARPRRYKIGRSRAGNILVFIMLLLISVFMLLPLIYVISNAFKPMDELFMFPPRFLVRRPTTENFLVLATLTVSSAAPVSRYFTNTIFVAAAVIAGHIILCTFTAYYLEKRQFPGKKLLFSLVVLSLMFAGDVTAIPKFLILSRFNWIDTYLAVIVPLLGGTLGLYLIKQFMSGVPDSLIESAKLDGAREPQIIMHIVMPLIKPAWLTLSILDLQMVWGMTANDVIFSEEKKLLSFAASQLTGEGLARAGASAALSLLMLTVPLLGFIFTQSRMLQTMASSGMKE